MFDLILVVSQILVWSVLAIGYTFGGWFSSNSDPEIVWDKLKVIHEIDSSESVNNKHKSMGKCLNDMGNMFPWIQDVILASMSVAINRYETHNETLGSQFSDTKITETHSLQTN